MTAILTKYLPVTNTKPARIKASANGFSIIQSLKYELNGEQNHMDAAQNLCKKMDWHGKMFGGQLNDGNYVFVFATCGLQNSELTFEA